MKKLVSILLAGSIAAAMLPCTGFAAEESAAATTTGSFTYTENFDAMADGSLPVGWELYRNKTGYSHRTIKAQVKNGALEISENNKDGRGGYLIFDTAGFADVQAQGLTMECDITLGNSLGVTFPSNELTAEDCVGFAYDFDESKIDPAKIADVNGVKVVDGGVPETAAFRVRMYTNKGADTSGEEITTQMLLSEKYNKDNLYRNLPITSTLNKINTAGAKQKMKLKMQVSNQYYHPTIYLNNSKLTNTGDGYITPQRTSGKIGLYIKNAAVTIDNIKIMGTATYPTATEYKASFKKYAAKYESIEAAKADVLVAEYDCFGNVKTDVTASSTITGTDNGDGTGTISVTYGDYSTTLAFSILDKEKRSFVYEENFDAIADGSLPEGWTLYRNKSGNASKTIKAEVRNGALEITDNNYWSKGYLIFDIPELADVNSKDLTMECDITLGNSLGITGDNRDTDCIGFAYGFDESKITKTIYDENGVKVVDGGANGEAAFRVSMYTNKGTNTAGEEITNQILYSEKTNKNGAARAYTITSAENKINTAGTAKKMKLKIAIPDVNYYPEIYLNGNEVSNAIGLGDPGRIDPDRTSGKIGLYINDTAVTIDNIKITGTRSDFAPNTDSLAISNMKYDSANSKLSVATDASLAAAAGSSNSAIIAAVYDNSDNLVSVNIVDASNIAEYHGTIALNNVSSAPAKGKVKVFFWDTSKIKPIASSAVK